MSDDALDGEIDDVRFTTVATALWADASPEARDVGERCPGNLHVRPVGDEIEFYLVDRDNDNREVPLGRVHWDHVRELSFEEILAGYRLREETYQLLEQVTAAADDLWPWDGWPWRPPAAFVEPARAALENLDAVFQSAYGERMSLQVLIRFRDWLGDNGQGRAAEGLGLYLRWVLELSRRPAPPEWN